MKGTIKISVGTNGGVTDVRKVDAQIHGAWAAHEDIHGIFEWRVTMIRFGLAVPFDFRSLTQANAAAAEINALRPDWDDLTAEQVLAEASSIIEICERHEAIRSPGNSHPPVPISEIEAALP